MRLATRLYPCKLDCRLHFGLFVGVLHACTALVYVHGVHHVVLRFKYIVFKKQRHTFRSRSQAHVYLARLHLCALAWNT